MKTQHKKTVSGFTLIEVMVVVSIVGIILGLAAPDIRSMVASNNLASISNQFVSALHLARSEAIKRNTTVSIRRTSAPNPEKWGNGWTVYIDADADGAVDSTETIIAVYEAITTNSDIPTTTSSTASLKKYFQIAPYPNPTTTPYSPFRTLIAYTPNGRANSSGNIYVCSPSSTSDYREINISVTGRVAISTPSKSGNPAYATVCQ